MTTQTDKSKIEEMQEPQGKPKVMFLEYTDWKQGQHAISAIVKGPREKRGRVAARIFIEFAGEPKKAIYTARDNEGNNLYPPTEKLWELKKTIKENAQTLYNKVHPEIKALAQARQMSKQPVVQKDQKGIEKQIIEGGKKVEGAVQNVTKKTAREQEMKNVRQNKVDKSKGVELEP
jgi:hypothetical protein